jgi:hypothetical protein
MLQIKLNNAFWSGNRFVNDEVLHFPMQEGGFSLINLQAKHDALKLRNLQEILTKQNLISRFFKNVIELYDMNNKFIFTSNFTKPFPVEWNINIKDIIVNYKKFRSRFEVDFQALNYDDVMYLSVIENNDIRNDITDEVYNFEDIKYFSDVLNNNGISKINLSEKRNRMIFITCTKIFNKLNKTKNTTDRILDKFISVSNTNNKNVMNFQKLDTKLFYKLIKFKEKNNEWKKRWKNEIIINNNAISPNFKVLYSYPTIFKDSDIAAKLTYHSLPFQNRQSHFDENIKRECTLCNEKNGTLSHRYLKCESLTYIKKTLKELLKKIDKNVLLTENFLIFGPYTVNEKNVIISFLLTINKVTIYDYHKNYLSTIKTNTRTHAQRMDRILIGKFKKRLNNDMFGQKKYVFESLWNQFATIENKNLTFLF